VAICTAHATKLLLGVTSRSQGRLTNMGTAVSRQVWLVYLLA
jgi:hypothetical protein